MRGGTPQERESRRARTVEPPRLVILSEANDLFRLPPHIKPRRSANRVPGLPPHSPERDDPAEPDHKGENSRLSYQLSVMSASRVFPAPPQLSRSCGRGKGGDEPCAAGGGRSKARKAQRSNKSSAGAAAPRRLLRVPQAGIQSSSVKLHSETRAPSTLSELWEG